VFRGANRNTDYYLVAAKVRKRLSVSKRAAQKYYMDRMNFKKLNDMEVKEEYQIKSSNRFVDLENLDDDDDDDDDVMMMMMAWTTLGLGKVLQNIKATEV
jgi:hypothetical protein